MWMKIFYSIQYEYFSQYICENDVKTFFESAYKIQIQLQLLKKHFAV